MFKFNITEDIDLIKQIVTDKLSWDAGTDDYANPADKFEPVFNNIVKYYLVTGENNAVYGLFIVVEKGRVLAELHFCTTANLQGLFSKALHEFCNHLFETTEFLRIIIEAPEINRLVINGATKAGLVIWGRNPKSFMKHKKLIDLVCLGISKKLGEK